MDGITLAVVLAGAAAIAWGFLQLVEVLEDG